MKACSRLWMSELLAVFTATPPEVDEEVPEVRTVVPLPQPTSRIGQA